MLYKTHLGFVHPIDFLAGHNAVHYDQQCHRHQHQNYLVLLDQIVIASKLDRHSKHLLLELLETGTICQNSL